METKNSETDSSPFPPQQYDVIQQPELEYFVQSLRQFQLEEIGTRKWLDVHEMILKLSQQAVLEASAYREELTKEYLVLHQKLKVLIHEAFCIMIWKTKVLPEIIEIDPNPPASFLIYTILFHEASVITLLEVALFHQNGCESLEETALDLVDYCAQGIAQLIGLVNMGHHENFKNIDVDESILSEMERQKRDLLYKIGLRCISILNYLVDKLDSLPLGVGKRMVTVHDIPCLLSDTLHFRPWLRKTNTGFEKFIDGKWTFVGGDKLLTVTKYEAQAWLCFRQLLFNEKLMQSYEINEFRQRELAKCQGILNETILDQLPPMAELKHHLCTLQVTGNSKNRNSHQNLLLEEVPQIKEKIIIKAENFGGYLKIAMLQSDKVFVKDREEIFDMAKRLNEAYNSDFLLEMEEKFAASSSATEEETLYAAKEKLLCGNCTKDATKKCANCLTVHYCSRECQVENWPTHKLNCIAAKQ